jgi:calcium/calmodulin-dependent protein kinase (CaM kinase) II
MSEQGPNNSSALELLALNQRLLESILAADWATYESLCDPSLSAFEPEGRGQRIEGLPFHRFYFERGGCGDPRQVTMASPHVRLMGDAAVVSYVRLVQKIDAAGAPITIATEETRVWQRREGRWRHVHFHRSLPQSP